MRSVELGTGRQLSWRGDGLVAAGKHRVTTSMRSRIAHAAPLNGPLSWPFLERYRTAQPGWRREHRLGMTENTTSKAAASSANPTPVASSGRAFIRGAEVTGNNAAAVDEDRSVTLGAVDAGSVERALRLVDATNTEPMLAAWRLADDKRHTGSSRIVSDRAALAAGLILAEERSPLLVSEFATLFRTRLTPDARRLMGVENVPVMADVHRDERAWYARCWRAVHSIIDTFNAWPARGRLMSREERVAVIAACDPEMQVVKSERAREFTYAWLDMTLQTLPEQYRDAWRGGLSADQTAVRAPSQRMPWRRNQALAGHPEVPELRQHVVDNADTQTIEAPRPVLEIDATPHPRRMAKSSRFAGADGAYEMAYAANITIMVAEPGRAHAHPQLIMAASLHRFGRSTAEHTLAGIKSIQDRGWRPNRLTADRGYSAGLTPADFHDPLSRMGVELVCPSLRAGGVQRPALGDDLIEDAATYPAEQTSVHAGRRDEWLRTYAHDRQAIESLNASMKAEHGLNESPNRRMRGLAAQSFLFTLIIAATNLDRIDKFLTDTKS
jgi:hypothetical protein